MSATEQLMERVKTLNEDEAKQFLDLLNQLPPAPKSEVQPRGPMAALGWAKKHNHPYKTTAEWMAVLREGEKD
jgi:hypothetical protein